MDSGREDKNPWVKWYWQDWLADTGLRLSSLAARGLWMEMLAIMAKGEKRGFLIIGSIKLESKSLAKLISEDSAVVETLLAELKLNGVYSVDKSGVIYSRRMEREAHLSSVRAKAGRLGGLRRSNKESKNDSKTKARSASAYASASASASESEEEEDVKFAEFWSAYPQEGRLAKKESRVKFGALVKRGELAEFIKGFHGYLDFLKHQRLKNNFDQRPMYAKTFLNGRWQEFIGFKYEAPL